MPGGISTGAATVTPKPKRQRQPRQAGDGLLSLDTRLDIIGVAMIVIALVSVLSFLSQEPGMLTRALLRFLYQGFGWGAYVVPLGVGAIGVWLIWRHFGDQLPPVDPVRIAGAIIAFVAALTLIHAGVAAAQPIGQVWVNPLLADPNQPDYQPGRVWEEARACPVRPQELIDQGWIIQTSYLSSYDIARCGHGGGYIGAFIQVTLAALIGGPAVFLIGLVVLFAGLLMLTRTTLKEVMEHTATGYSAVRTRVSDARAARAARAVQALEAEGDATVTAPARGQVPASATPQRPSSAAPPLQGRPSIVTGRGPGGTVPPSARPSAADLEDEEEAEVRPAAGLAGAAAAGAAAGAAAAPAPRPGGPPGASPLPRPGGPPAPTQRPLGLGAEADDEDDEGTASEDRPGTAPGGPAAPPLSRPGAPAGVPPRPGASQPPGVRPAEGPSQRPGTPGSAAPGAGVPPRPGGPPAPAGGDRDRQGSSGVPGIGSASRPGAPLPRPGLPGKPAVQPSFGGARPAPKPLEPSEDEDDGEDEDILFDDLATGPPENAIELDDGDVLTGPKAPVSEPPRPAGPPERARDAGGAERPAPVGPPAPAGPARPSPLAGGSPISGPPRPTAPPTERRDGGSAPSGPRPGGPANPQNRPGTMGITPAPAAPAPAPRERPMPPSRPGSEPPRSSAPAKVGEGTSKKRVEWKLPDIDRMLETKSRLSVSDEELRRRAEQIEQTLSSFGAPGRVVEVNHGPVITQFGVEPDYVDGRAGKRIKVKVAKISSLADDLALSLEAPTIRIEAPVPGKGYVGIEVPNEQPSIVGLKDVIDTPEFRNMKTPLRMALGQDVSGQPVVADLTSMPHLLIAGTTGSGKSVCVNGIIATMLMTSTPDQLRLIMIDPKRVELTNYNGIPHLMAPVVTELERIVGVLKWVQREMDDRYRRFAMAGARNITDYNSRVAHGKIRDGEALPYIVVIVDELADLMMLAPDETERVITRLAQMARATGIHIILSTQRPSVDVVTGLIKANFPARIAFAVATGVDSRVILDMPGAEKLLGRGDMLFQPPDVPMPIRMQGTYVSDDEIQNITDFWREQGEKVPPAALSAGTAAGAASVQKAFLADPEAEREDGVDELFDEAVALVREKGKASISMLQRHLRIGYTRAARLIEAMEEMDIVAEHEGGSRQRSVFDDEDEEDAL